MDDDILELIEVIIKSGFYSREAAEQYVGDVVYDSFEKEDDIPNDEEIKKIVDGYYAKLDGNGKNFAKLKNAFDELTKQNIIALHDAGYTKQDGYGEVSEARQMLQRKGVAPIGYCFYHRQDMERAMGADPNLFLAFDSIDQNNEAAVLVGETVVKALEAEGLSVIWNHTVDQRIKIDNFKWDKIWDGQIFDIERVVGLMSN